MAGPASPWLVRWGSGGLQGFCCGAAGAKEALLGPHSRAGLGWAGVCQVGSGRPFPALHSGTWFFLFEVSSLDISAHREVLPWAMCGLGVDSSSGGLWGPSSGGFLLQKTGLPAWSCLPPPVTRAELSAVRVLFAGLVSMANFSHGSKLAGSRFQLPEGRSLQVCEWRESVSLAGRSGYDCTLA